MNKEKRYCIVCGKELNGIPPTCSTKCSEKYFNSSQEFGSCTKCGNKKCSCK